MAVRYLMNNGLTLDDERIRQAIIEFRPRLVVIDPIQAYLGSDSDPLKGKVYCGYCQKLMKYRVLKKLGPSFNCRFSATAVDSPCKRIPISEELLEHIVRNALTAQIKQAEHVLEILHERERKALICFSALERQEEKLSAEKAEIVKQRAALYEQYRDNPRILKQDGAFIISGLDASDKESDNKIREFLVKELIIPKEAKKQLRKELEYVGINQASLFPEVDKVADYLRRMA